MIPKKSLDSVLDKSIILTKTAPNDNAKSISVQCGGGRILPIGQEIACHFSQDHTMVTKFLGFIHKHPKYKVVKSFFYYLDRFSRNLAETAKKLQFFEIEKFGIDFFSFFSKQKSVILFQISMTIVLSFLLRYITFL